MRHLDLVDIKGDLGRFGKLHVRHGKGARGSGLRERMVPLSELLSARIQVQAAKLGLAHLAKNLPELINRAADQQMGYLDFLDLITAEEVAMKDDNRFRHTLRVSRLPHHKTDAMKRSDGY